MRARLIQREVVPFLLSFAALTVGTLLLDGLLHALRLVWVGRYLGIPGVLLILLSFRYSLRKRGLIRSGDTPRLLRRHELLAWTGSLLVLVHAGVHFNAILAWLAVAAMIVNVGSGLTGKFLLDRSHRRLAQARQLLQQQGVAAAQSAEHLYWDSLTFDAVRQWRTVHLPITLAFAVLATAHIAAALLFWNWR